MDISIVIPCYNECEVIPFFYNNVSEVLTKIGKEYELIFIDDGSKDNTFDIIHNISIRDKRVHYISFSRNFGKESAILCGLYNSKGEYVAIMDVDMQDPPSLLFDMVKILSDEGDKYDSVVARRINRKGEGMIRSIFSNFFYNSFNRISDTHIKSGVRDYRMMRRNIITSVLEMKEYTRFSKGLFEWVSDKTFWLDFENVERYAGKTKWNFKKLFKYALEGITSFSDVPLTFISWIGLGFTLTSFLLLLIVIIRRIVFGDPVAGWASLVCIMLFIGGIQMLCIGVMGQYMAKIFLETKHRPHYIIDKTDLNTERIG